MGYVEFLLVAGVAAAAIVNHIRLNRAYARIDSLYSMLYGFRYRIREVEGEVKESIDGLRYEINPAAAPAEAHGCGSGGCGSHSHEAAAPALPQGGQLLQIS